MSVLCGKEDSRNASYYIFCLEYFLGIVSFKKHPIHEVSKLALRLLNCFLLIRLTQKPSFNTPNHLVISTINCSRNFRAHRHNNREPLEQSKPRIIVIGHCSIQIKLYSKYVIIVQFSVQEHSASRRVFFFAGLSNVTPAKKASH